MTGDQWNRTIAASDENPGDLEEPARALAQFVRKSRRFGRYVSLVAFFAPAQRGARTLERQLLEAARDVVSDLARVGQADAGGVREAPVDVPPAREDGARGAPAHREDPGGP